MYGFTKSGGFTETFMFEQFLEDIDDALNPQLFQEVTDLKVKHINLQIDFDFEIHDHNSYEIEFRKDANQLTDEIVKDFIRQASLGFVLYHGLQLVKFKLEVESTMNYYLKNTGYDKAFKLAADYYYDMEATMADMVLDELKEREEGL